jgi:hypothetical protein
VHDITVQIVRFVDESQPRWVECELVDANGRRHLIIDKVPIFTLDDLRAESKYPVPGIVRCEVLRKYKDERGREVVHVSTAQPWGIESTEGLSEFILPASLVTPVQE